MDEIDRALILRRRALFVGSALAALGGCARGGAPAEHGASDPVVVVPAEPDAGDTEPEIDPDAGSRRERADLDKPSFDIPDGVSEAAHSHYEYLATAFGDAYRLLDEMEAGIPSCAITDASCESDWRAMAEKQYDLERAFSMYYICPGSSDEAKAFAERERAHRAYFDARRKVVKERLDAALGADGKAAFERMVNEVRMGRPVPCLSFACQDW